MTYYKVKKQYDNAPRYTVKDGIRFYDSSLIGGELYTAKELARFFIPEKALEKVEIPKNRVYRSFGARFQF